MQNAKSRWTWLWTTLLAGLMVGANAGVSPLVAAEPATAEPTQSETVPAAVAKDDSSAPTAEKPQAEKKAKSEAQYVRVVRDERNRPRSMDTAILRFRLPNKDGKKVIVDLIAAVHVGDSAYYEELNKRFQRYDAVLYELVAPEGTRVPRGGAKSDHPVGVVQDGMKDLLRLEHQLSKIDYQQENLVHADMTPEEFAASMEARGENMVTIFLRLLEESMKEQQRNPRAGQEQMEMFLALFSPQRPLMMKRLLATQFEDMERASSMFNGPDGSTLITERNKKAFKVLAEQLDAGHHRLAVFYGAGHLPDMVERLEKEFDGKLKSTRWVTAWDLRDPSQRAADEAAKKLKAAEKEPDAKKPAKKKKDAAR